MLGRAEYIWMDGSRPTELLRSKTRILDLPSEGVALDDFPDWGFDGSSTSQAEGGNSDLELRPVRFVANPLGGVDDYLVLCEVYDDQGEAHPSNTRAQLREVLGGDGAGQNAWVGFEQEYTLFANGRPLGFPEGGLPEPQGPYYCGVGADRVFGRDLVEAHTEACLKAGLMLYGINAEVMPGQWEFQIGYRGISTESADPLTVSDHLLMARWLLFRIAEDFGVVVSLEPKPVRGDWNGAGAHTNFSTTAMRAPGGLEAIENAIEQLEQSHNECIAAYGAGLEKRLTGLHETCAIDEFKGGVADRGASIRIPRSVEMNGCGYLEDRRPGANCDPYRVCRLLLGSVIGPRRVPLAQAS